MAVTGIPLSEWSGSGATRELHDTIRLQIASMDRQSQAIKRLTIFMAILALIQTVATIVQSIPIVQGLQDKQATGLPSNTTGRLGERKNNAPPVIHLSPAPVVPAVQMPHVASSPVQPARKSP